MDVISREADLNREKIIRRQHSISLSLTPEVTRIKLYRGTKWKDITYRCGIFQKKACHPIVIEHGQHGIPWN